MCVLSLHKGKFWCPGWEALEPGLLVCVSSLCLNLQLCPFCLYLSFSSLPIFLVLAGSLPSRLQNTGLCSGLRGCPGDVPCPQFSLWTSAGPQPQHRPKACISDLCAGRAHPTQTARSTLHLFLIASLPTSSYLPARFPAPLQLASLVGPECTDFLSASVPCLDAHFPSLLYESKAN